ncbi:MAG: hypothetical protein HQL05_05505 [Nitrospirae bacterium]|uniref:CopG family transcriptional regulator n=2 Tax=Nitrospirota TaxID=40117 RepID=A0A142BU00_9BACT|nr:hypothetical protein [Candidatus Magnetobacterium casensis]AIM41336.1 hypothetical protein Mcas_0741 [Candidatus Magnetobacterium casensis]AMP41588.1 hypothetical protein [uncultured Nitrospirota bacterium]MBF0337269.1 hypothetical protein [Nitrospirota bacterium]
MVISTEIDIDKEVFDLLSTYAKEWQVSENWIIQKALTEYLFDKYDEDLSDMRIASLSEADSIAHEDVLKEYGLSS